MPTLCANLSWLYPEIGFRERFAAAAKDGFRAVEIQFPYADEPAELASRLGSAGLELVLFNAPPGDYLKGERGLAALPGREDDFRRAMTQAFDYARVLGNRRIHVMAGVVAQESERARMRDTYLANLAWAAGVAKEEGLTILIEPINPRDMPGYFLNRQADAHAIRAEVGSPALRVQMDLYHCQVVEGDVETKIRRYLPDVGHVQVAGVPARSEPDRGELNVAYLLGVLDELGYDGYVGCEYRPGGRTSDGLAWARPWLAPAAKSD